MSTVQHIHNPSHNSPFGHNYHIPLGEAGRSSDERMRVILNLTSSLQQQQANSLASKEKEFLENTVKFLDSFSRSIDNFIKHEEANIKKIRDEVLNYYPNQTKNDEKTSEMKREITNLEKKVYVIIDYQRAIGQKKKDIVNKINPTELSKIKFKNVQDESNDIFRWCLQAIYNGPKSSYTWSNFKKQVLVNEKGEDFLLRLRGLNLNKLKKDDFVFARTILEKKIAYIAEIERGKDNTSLRRLLEYIDIVVEYSQNHEEYEAEKEILEQKQREFNLKMIEFQKIGNIIQMLEHKMNDSYHYIEVLNKLKPYLISNISATKDRLYSIGQNSKSEPISNIRVMHAKIQRQPSHPKVYEDDGPEEEENTSRDVNHVYPQVKKDEMPFSKAGDHENCSLF